MKIQKAIHSQTAIHEDCHSTTTAIANGRNLHGGFLINTQLQLGVDHNDERPKPF